MTQKHIDTNKLKDNMILGKSVITSNGVILVGEGTIVTSEVRNLLCRHFITDVVINILDETESLSESNISKQVHFEPDFLEFQKNFKQGAQEISSRMENIVLQNEEVDTDELIGLLGDIVGDESNSVHLCNMLYKMKQTAGSVYVHSISVALVAQLMAKRQKMSPEDIKVVTVGALLHDIGLLKVPEAIVNKKEALTSQERIEYEKHPIYGFQMIKERKIDQRIKQVVLTHHERIDGSGYPLKVHGEYIIRISKLIAIVDAYDGMISDRPGKKMLTPFDVLRNFESNGYHKFDTMLLINFLTMIEDSFIHQSVLLNNGEIGEVVMMNKSELSRPLVKVDTTFYDLSLRKDLDIVKMIQAE